MKNQQYQYKNFGDPPDFILQKMEKKIQWMIV